MNSLSMFIVYLVGFNIRAVRPEGMQHLLSIQASLYLNIQKLINLKESFKQILFWFLMINVSKKNNSFQI